MKKKPRTPWNVLYVHCESDLYGSNRSLLNLCANLDRSRFRPLVLLAGRGPLQDALEAHGVRVMVHPLSYIRRSLSPRFLLRFGVLFLPGILSVCRLIRRHRIDLVHTNTIHVQAGALAARLCGIPHVWHVREIIPRPKMVMVPLLKSIQRLADQVICISRAVQREMLKMAGTSDNITCVYNAVDLTRFSPMTDMSVRQELNIPPAAPVVGMVGRLTYWKGQDIFIEAAYQISQCFPAARFLIVGAIDRAKYKPYEKRLTETARTLGLQDKIVFTGFRQDVPRLMAAMDVVVVPSTRPEPFGLVAIEAMAMRKPVVATDHGGIPEIISHAGLGTLVRPGDPGAIAAGVEPYLQHPERRHKTGERARRHVQQRFTIKAYVAGIQQIYQRLLTA